MLNLNIDYFNNCFNLVELMERYRQEKIKLYTLDYEDYDEEMISIYQSSVKQFEAMTIEELLERFLFSKLYTYAEEGKV